MQIKVNKLQKTVDGDVQGASAVVIFLDKGNIVHEERFTGKTDSVYSRQVEWNGKYDKHEAVILDGGEFEYELVLDDPQQKEAMDALTSQAEALGLYKNISMESFEFTQDKPLTGIRNSSTKKNADK